ncbi:protein SOSEKI 2 [Apium graveolens]|uniref:protein SOSEKI 2 n=1 Tax=Apium graveolens TaxID=4045 RepID=UPI003D7C0DEC
MEVRGKNRRERTPERERGRASVQIQLHETTRTTTTTRVLKQPPPSFKKVQVVYYLSKNGQLEHPHFMEVTHLAHHHLRLKDVLERLTVLRGRSMPSLYSWSYKRSYRNGYVWNDLAENDDIISPSEGAEYVLKGSELIETACTEKYHHPQVVIIPEPSTYHAKRKTLPPKRHGEPQEFDNNITSRYEDEEEEYFDEKTTYTAPNTPYSRCSIGVSTDEIELDQQNKTAHKPSSPALTNHNSSPPSATSSSLSDKANDNSKRFEDGDIVGTESILSRNSVLYNLIACGGSVSFRGKSKVPIVKEQEELGRKSSSLHKGVLKNAAAAKVAVVEDEDDHDQDVIRCMSENPRFGNLQSEEKEYFSGSIVEAICEDERIKAVPMLKKSNSYNEERSSKACLDVVGEEKDVKKKTEKDCGKGKCIPRSKKSSTSCLSSFI